MIKFMNLSSKYDLQVLKEEDMTTMIMMENKVAYKHKYVQSVKNKEEALEKKVHHFKNKFTNLFNKGMPSFLDEKGNFISREDYHVLLVQKMSEEENFEYLDKHFKSQIIVDILSEDLDLLSEFKLIQKNMRSPLYVQSVELKVMTKEMLAYEHPLKNQWESISKFGTQKLNLH